MPTRDETCQRCEAALDRDDQRKIAAALARIGTTVDECVAHVATVDDEADTRRALQVVKTEVQRLGVAVDGGAFERFVLLSSALSACRRLESVSVSASVKALCHDVFAGYADPRRTYEIEGRSFVEQCKIASLRRFPAGQFDWEPGGLPRSWVARLRPLGAMARALYLILAEMRGFSPMFVVHMGTSRKNFALIEREAERSYYRMAESMMLQPAVKGLLISSWLHSPDTYSVSPHLAWLNRVFLENRGVVGTTGPADPRSGVFHRSPERERAFEEGRYRPTDGLVIWARADLLAWSRRHPELES